MKRFLSHLAAGLSLLLCIGVCVLWARGRTGTYRAEWRHDRYLPQRSADTAYAQVSSRQHLWLDIGWTKLGPIDWQPTGGYASAQDAADRSRLTFRRVVHEWTGLRPADPNARETHAGLGPLRWKLTRRTKAADGDDHRSLRLGVSHWLAALLLLIAPTLWANRFRRERRNRRRGLCPACGYDLRASAGRCPECGGSSNVQ